MRRVSYLRRQFTCRDSLSLLLTIVTASEAARGRAYHKTTILRTCIRMIQRTDFDLLAAVDGERKTFPLSTCV